MSLYLWVKALHIIFVIALMAALLIYPRYKLHQIISHPGDELFETMKESSDRLRRIILNPSILIVWVLGLTMIALNQSLLTMGWMHTKLLLVVILSGVHGYFISMGKKIDRGELAPTSKTLKMRNELPFIIMIFAVLLAVLKPF